MKGSAMNSQCLCRISPGTCWDNKRRKMRIFLYGVCGMGPWLGLGRHQVASLTSGYGRTIWIHCAGSAHSSLAAALRLAWGVREGVCVWARVDNSKSCSSVSSRSPITFAYCMREQVVGRLPRPHRRLAHTYAKRWQCVATIRVARRARGILIKLVVFVCAAANKAFTNPACMMEIIWAEACERRSAVLPPTVLERVLYVEMCSMHQRTWKIRTRRRHCRNVGVRWQRDGACDTVWPRIECEVSVYSLCSESIHSSMYDESRNNSEEEYNPTSSIHSFLANTIQSSFCFSSK